VFVHTPQYQIPTIPVCVGGTSVQPVAVVRNPGLYLDADVTMRSHVTSTDVCFADLQQISSIPHSLSRPALLSLLRALVISKRDYLGRRTKYVGGLIFYQCFFLLLYFFAA